MREQDETKWKLKREVVPSLYLSHSSTDTKNNQEESDLQDELQR